MAYLSLADPPRSRAIRRRLVHDAPRLSARIGLKLALDPAGTDRWNGTLAKYYRETPEIRDALAAYVRQPPVRTLLEIGRGTDIHCESIEGQDRLSDCDWVDLVYAVRYEEAGRKKSFRVVLHLLRLRLSVTPTTVGGSRIQAVWRLTGTEQVGVGT